MMEKRLIDNDVMLPEIARLIASGHTVTLRVKGQSMNPFLRHGRDQVTLASPEVVGLQSGVVVLAREQGSGRIVLHRIIHREGDRLTLQGDGNVLGTELTTVDQVMGQVVEVIRGTTHYPVSGRIWRWYSRCWLRLRPLRRWLLAAYRRL